MVLIEQFNESISAQNAQELLQLHGISSRLAVDPLSSRAPALGDFGGVGLFVDDSLAERAINCLRLKPPLGRKVS